MVYAILAYGAWGLVPLFWHALAGVDALEILAHRVLWSLVFVALLISLSGRGSSVKEALRSFAKLKFLLASGALIALNWGIFIWAVLHDRLIEASLGYFMNPLVNVVLGVTLLGERLRPAQSVAVGLGGVGLLLMLLFTSSPVWIALTLASSFAIYGLLRKLAPVDTLVGLLVETLLVAPFAVAFVLTRAASPDSAFGLSQPGTTALLVLSGPVTALPLACFGAAARRLPLSRLGFFQYLAPSLQFLTAALVFGELVDARKLLAFAVIWLALGVVTVDALRAQASRPARMVESSRS